jgi:AraC-like DNA-binding protein
MTFTYLLDHILLQWVIIKINRPIGEKTMATVDLHYAQSIVRCLQRRNIDTDKLLQDLELTDNAIFSDYSPLDKSQRVASDKITFLVKYTWALLNDEFMGCTAKRCKPGVFALMSRYALTQQTLQEVLEQGLHFYNLFTDDIQMSLNDHGHYVEIEFKFAQAQLDIDNFFQEFWLVIWHRFASWIIGEKIILNQVTVPYSQPKHYNELKNAFECRLSFNQPQLKFSFNKRYLNLAPTRSQQDLTIFLKNSPADLIAIPGNEISYKAKIKSRLIYQSGQQLICPALESLAAEFKISSQTLRRKLKLENTSYPQIKDEIRRNIAIDKLNSQYMPIAQIARLLGFSESRSFTRAFRKWTTLSPSEYLQSVNKHSDINRADKG